MTKRLAATPLVLLVAALVACKTGSPTASHFGYAGPMTESVLLGNVALRVGKKIEWDAKHLKAVHCPEAAAFLRESGGFEIW